MRQLPGVFESFGFKLWPVLVFKTPRFVSLRNLLPRYVILYREHLIVILEIIWFSLSHFWSRCVFFFSSKSRRESYECWVELVWFSLLIFKYFFFIEFSLINFWEFWNIACTVLRIVLTTFIMLDYTRHRSTLKYMCTYTYYIRWYIRTDTGLIWVPSSID